jgi:hypothetical protein
MGIQSTSSSLAKRSPSSKDTSLTLKTRHGRAINAVGAFLRSTLRVPNVYLEPNIPSIKPSIDVLAVDAAGSGDIYVVEIKVPNTTIGALADLLAYVKRLRDYPSHFKYLALPKTAATERLAKHPMLFAPNGIGRVGLLLIRENNDAPPTVENWVNAERFRINLDDLAVLEKFASSHSPDMAVRI